MARPKKKTLGLARPLSKAGKQNSLAKGTIEASLVSTTSPRDQTEERPAKRVKWRGTKGDSKTTAKLVKGLQNAKSQSTQPEAKKNESEKTEEPLKPAIKPSDKPKGKSKSLDKRPTNPPPPKAPQLPNVIGQPAQDSTLSKLTPPLHDSHDVVAISIISSSPIQKKVARVLSHFSSSLSKPALVILTAKAGVASKAISIAEIAKRELGKVESGVWFQYSAIEGVIFERPVKLSKRENKAQKAKQVESSAKATEPLVPSPDEAVGTIAEKAKGSEEDGEAAESAMTSTHELTWSATEIRTENKGEKTRLLVPSGEVVTTDDAAEKTAGTKDINQDEDDDDSAFETMPNPAPKIIEAHDSFPSTLDEKKIRAVPVLTIFISRTRIEALKKEYE